MKVVPLLTAAVVSSASISTATASDINAIINDKSNPHHHRRSGPKKNRNNNGQRRDLSTKSEKAITSNIDTNDIYSRSSEKTTAEAIDTLAFVDDAATDGKDGQRNLIEVSSHEEVVESNEEDDVSIFVKIWYMSHV